MKKFLFVFLAAIFILPVIGRDKILNIGNNHDPYALDPHLVSSVAEYKVISAIFEGLVNLNPETLEPEGGVAESWTISENGLVYTFKIRQDAKWSDGEKITANDFIFSAKRVLSRQLASPNVDLLFFLQNAKRYFYGDTTNFDEVGIKAVDDSTLIMTLTSNVNYFLSILALPVWFPVNEKCVTMYGKPDDRCNKWSREGNIISNGAFSVKKWEIGDSIILMKNKYYWDNYIVNFDIVKFWNVNDASVEERMFLSGELDVTESVIFSSIKNDGLQNEMHIVPYLGCFFYTLNVRNELLSDKNVRKAIYLAIDREALLATLNEPRNLATYVLVPKEMLSCQSIDNTVRSFQDDLQEAKNLLARSETYERLKNTKITLLYNTSIKNKTMAEFVQASLKENLNLDIELIGQEWKTFIYNRSTRNYDMIKGGWIGDYKDPMTFLDLFVTGGLQNHGLWSDAEYDSLLNKASANGISNEARIKLLQKAEQILIDDAGIIPLFFESSHHLVSKKISGWYDNCLDIHPLKYMDITD